MYTYIHVYVYLDAPRQVRVARPRGPFAVDLEARDLGDLPLDVGPVDVLAVRHVVRRPRHVQALAAAQDSLLAGVRAEGEARVLRPELQSGLQVMAPAAQEHLRRKQTDNDNETGNLV